MAPSPAAEPEDPLQIPAFAGLKDEGHDPNAIGDAQLTGMHRSREQGATWARSLFVPQAGDLVGNQSNRTRVTAAIADMARKQNASTEAGEDLLDVNQVVSGADEIITLQIQQAEQAAAAQVQQQAIQLQRDQQLAADQAAAEHRARSGRVLEALLPPVIAIGVGATVYKHHKAFGYSVLAAGGAFVVIRWLAPLLSSGIHAVHETGAAQTLSSGAQVASIAKRGV